MRPGRERLGHRAREAAVLSIEGRDRESFLQGQLTQDVRDLPNATARPFAGLTPKGKLLYVGRVVALPDRFLLILEGPGGPAAAHLARFAAFQTVTVRDATAEYVLRTLYGPGSDAVAAPDGAVRLPPRAETSGEFLAPASSHEALDAALAAAGSQLLSLEDAETLRVEAGRALFGRDADESCLPDEVGMQAAIAPDKGCYVGQEVVARLRNHGKIARRLVGFRFPDAMVPAGTAFEDPGKPGRVLARVTSEAVSPRFGPIGLGLASRDVPEGAALTAPGPPESVAVVVGLPFA